MKTPFTFNLQLFAEPAVNFEDILKNRQETGAVEQDNNGGYRYVE